MRLSPSPAGRNGERSCWAHWPCSRSYWSAPRRCTGPLHLILFVDTSLAVLVCCQTIVHGRRISLMVFISPAETNTSAGPRRVFNAKLLQDSPWDENILLSFLSFKLGGEYETASVRSCCDVILQIHRNKIKQWSGQSARRIYLFIYLYSVFPWPWFTLIGHNIKTTGRCRE